MNLFGHHTNSDAAQQQPSDPLNGYRFTPPPQLVYPTGSVEDIAQHTQPNQADGQIAGGPMVGMPPQPGAADVGSWQPPSPNNDDIPLIPGSPDSG